MLISVEHELPTLARNGDAGVLPEVFLNLWDTLGHDAAWSRDGPFAVSRPITTVNTGAMKPYQVITTDTGPTIELAPAPAERIRDIETQMTELRMLVRGKLDRNGVDMLGSGVHLRLGCSEGEYLQYRTPRKAYDYAIRQRGWKHSTILNVASLQEIVDVPTDTAPAVLGLLHRLAGAMLFMFRNDPEYGESPPKRRFTIRPHAWRTHVPSSGPFSDDRTKVYLPDDEICRWRPYLRLLWESSRMFMLGTKGGDLAYVQEHPTFIAFVRSSPQCGWRAKTMNGDDVQITPSMDHVIQTDWTYMGFARLRLFWKDGVSVDDVVRAYDNDDRCLEEFLSSSLRKVLVENRSNACPQPGEEMSSLAFVTGVIENLDAVNRFASRFPYPVWLSIASAAETHPMQTHVQGIWIPDLLLRLLDLSQEGLVRRAMGEERYLEPLIRRVRDGISPAEELLTIFDRDGMEAVTDRLLYYVRTEPYVSQH